MGLSVRFVENLDQVIAPVAEHLTTGLTDLDFFETDHLIVPNAGVRAWLLQKLAHTMGADPGQVNGAIGNVEVGFIGMLDRFITPGRRDADPWSLDHLTFAVLQAVHDLRDDADVAANIQRLGGGLKAARTMADRFDRYHARRPHMIRCWEAGRAELSPCVGEDSVLTDDDQLATLLVVLPLAVADTWQFTIWSRVRELIGQPSPPARTADALVELRRDGATAGVPRRIAVVGLQTLSSRHVEVLRALSGVTDITVFLVHPSPHLAAEWSRRFLGVPIAPGIAIMRPQLPAVPGGTNPLVWSWLRGSMDLQHMLAVNGIAPQPHATAATVGNNDLLGHLKRAIADPSSVAPQVIRTDDQSFLVHRAHNLARQVEVLHDALLHAFDQLPDLQPHEVVIVSPDIAAAAPHLQAVFSRPVTNARGESFVLPLVVADRGLREFDEGARLLADLITLLRSRFGVGEVLDVITSPLVLSRFGLGPDDVDTWRRYMERTRVRWGIDARHRSSAWNVDMGDEGLAHTWVNAIRRSLLGAVLPDADAPAVELGGVVPVIDVEPGEIRAITALAEIMSVLARAQSGVDGARPVAGWCALLEETLGDLVHDERGETDEALRAVGHFLSHSVVPAVPGELDVQVPVEFAHIGSLIAEQLTAAPGRQPLRTGAITATSMIPLRSVPFRVVCVVGLDDGVLGSGDAEGDDLESRQNLIGDADARLEQRRSLLDAVTAAQERVIITCVGRNVKNNVLTPLVTPLAELVELCGELGVGANSAHKDLSAVEVLHPRHFNSPQNFVKGQLVDGLVWSHSPSALLAARNSGAATDGAQPHPLDLKPLVEVPLEMLEQMVKDPLAVFLRGTLEISNWRDNRQDDPATVPLEISTRETVRLVQSLLGALAGGQSVEQWETAAVVGGDLPPGGYRTAVITDIKNFAVDMRAAVGEWASVSAEDVRVSLAIGDGRVLTGVIPGVHTREDGTVFLVRPCLNQYQWDDTRILAPLHMLVLSAMGVNVTDCASPGLHGDGDKAARRNIQPATPLLQSTSAARVSAIADLLETARCMPCPSFNGAGALAATDREAAADKFQARVGERGYARSDEAFVYGYAPFFDDVFPEDSPQVEFCAGLAGTLSSVVDARNQVPKGWRRYTFS